MESLKNNKNVSQQPKSIIKQKNVNNNNSISKSSRKEKKIETKKEENPMAKSLVIQTKKKIDFEGEEVENDAENVNNINNIISDVSNNINDIINKINSNESNNMGGNLSSKNSAGASVSFNFSTEPNDKKEKKKIDQEKKELRLSKAMQRIKKKQGGEQSTGTKLNKSTKVADMAKELENKMLKRDETNITEGNENDDVIIYENVESNDNNEVVNVLKNQQLTKSMKKKKSAKKFVDDQ